MSDGAVFVSAFGLGTLVFNGLEMAMHSMMEGSCLNDVVFVHPILHGLFTFLQMHFLFVNSQVDPTFNEFLSLFNHFLFISFFLTQFVRFL